MKRLLKYFIALLPLAAAADSIRFKDQTMKEKLNHPDLIFAATFDNRTLDADFAKGNPNTTTLKDVNLGLRGIIGFDGKQAFLPEGLEELKYSVKDNISIPEGTVIMWLKNESIKPASTHVKRGNIPLFEAKFMSGSDYLTYRLADYTDGTNYFEWANSYPPHSFGQTKYAAALMTDIQKGEWYQLAATWTPKEIQIYLNGELKATTALPAKAEKTINMKPDNRSYIGIRSLFYGSKNEFKVVADDFKIYRKALSPVVIKNQYLAICKELPKGKKIEAFSVNINGVDDGSGKKDSVEFEYDFSYVEKQFKKAADRKLVLSITDPTGKKISKTFTPDTINFCCKVDNIADNGKLQLVSELFLDGKSAGKVASSAAIPDLSFIGNTYGAEDTVPAIWTPIGVNGRNISVWNRKYIFGAGPFPTQILIGKNNSELFLKAPEFTFKNNSKIKWQAGKTVRKNSYVELHGTGMLNGKKLAYCTRIDFDGLLNCNITFPQGLTVNDMTLKYQQNPEFAKYLMTPTVYEKQTDPVVFPRMGDAKQEDPRSIWLVSEKGGFAFDVESDANWVFDKNENIYSANRKNGECSIKLVTRKVTYPADAEYKLLFIATPTRPLPAKIRGIRSYARSGKRIIFHNPAYGFKNIGTCIPADNFKQYFGKRNSDVSYIYYSMADAVCDIDPIVKYFKKYYDIPGRYAYRFNHRPDSKTKIQTFSQSACTACSSFIDYYMNNQKKAYDIPEFKKFTIMYYDLCGYGKCANEIHGCVFKDVFGRKISRSVILSKRNLVMRTVRLAHAHNRSVMLHAQRTFSPILHGLADYWLPGEQYGPLLARNSYGYTDEVPNIIWESEFNRNIIGTGILMSCSVGWIKPAKMKPFDITEAMLAATLPYDIETSALFANTRVMTKVYDIYDKTGITATKGVKFHRFDRQQEFKLSDNKCRLSYYTTPQGTVLIISNPTVRRKNLTVTVKDIIPTNCVLANEYDGGTIEVKNGKFNCKLTSRDFLILFLKK